MADQFDELRDLAAKLKDLLDDQHPGLVSWWNQLDRVMERINEIYPVAK